MKKLVYLAPRYKCRGCGKEFTISKIARNDVLLITVDIMEMLNDENTSERLHDKIPHMCDSISDNKETLIGIADLIGLVTTVEN